MVRWIVVLGMIAAGGFACVADAGQWRPVAIPVLALGAIAGLLEARRRARLGCMRCRGHRDAELRRVMPRLNGTTMIDLL